MRTLTCEECGPGGIAGWVTQLRTVRWIEKDQEGQDTIRSYAVEEVRPCSTCNPARHDVWARHGPVGPGMSSPTGRDGYPTNWAGEKKDAPPPGERGFPRWGDGSTSNPELAGVHVIQGELEASTTIPDDAQ